MISKSGRYRGISAARQSGDQPVDFKAARLRHVHEIAGNANPAEGGTASMVG